MSEMADQWWERRQAGMIRRKIDRAAQLGRTDAAAGVRRDMLSGDGVAWLQDQLAEPGLDTEAGRAMLDAYRQASVPMSRLMKP